MPYKLITFASSNGTVIQEDKVVDTFEETIKILGVERVAALNIIAFKKTWHFFDCHRTYQLVFILNQQ